MDGRARSVFVLHTQCFLNFDSQTSDMVRSQDASPTFHCLTNLAEILEVRSCRDVPGEMYLLSPST